MENFSVLIWLAALAIALAMVFAQVRLFSIDRTAKEIRDELRGRGSDPGADSFGGELKETIASLKL